MSLLGAVAGFFLVPIGAGIASNIVIGVAKPNPKNVALVNLAVAGTAAFASYKLADKYRGWHSFYRGGMWGSGLGAAGWAADFATDGKFLTARLDANRLTSRT